MRVVACAVALLTLFLAVPARALSLSGELSEGARRVGIQGGSASAFDALATAFAETASQTIPVISASAGFTYRYDAALEAFVRSSDTLGPIFLERPDTLGRGKLNVNVSYQYVELDQYDGESLGALQSPYDIVLSGAGAGGALPSTANRLVYNIQFLNHVQALSVTYGVLDNLDVNLLLPVLETKFDVTVRNQQVSIKQGGAFVPQPEPPVTAVLRGDSVGIGDLLVRAKYQLPRWQGLRSAAGLVLRMPTGDEDDLQGVGSFVASPAFYMSTLFWGRVEPHWNASIDLRADDVARSQAQYGFGVDVDATKKIGVALALRGRSEFAGTAPAGATSFLHRTPSGVRYEPLLGVHFDRKDFFDFSFGTRVVVWRQVMLFANGIYAINDAGLRNNLIIPTVGLEGTF